MFALTRPGAAVLCAAALLACAPAARAQDTLDRQLLDQALKLLDFARQKGAKNVGVLKFLVQKGTEPPGFSAGELNTALARRLEVALVLADPEEPAQQLGIIHDASVRVVDANNARADHRTARGRRAFFDLHDYPLAWGDDKVKADLFFTGLAVLNPQRTQLTVRIDAFGADGNLTEGVARFTAPVTARDLIDSGYSYALTPQRNPEAFDGGKGLVERKQAVIAAAASSATDANATAQADGGSGHTGGTANADTQRVAVFSEKLPVVLRILYNGKEVPQENGRVRPPQAGEEVTFELRNTSDKDTYAVALKVNGVNTLFSEIYPADMCRKWVLKPGETVPVRGFQFERDKMRPFVVRAPTTDEERRLLYSPFAGAFQMVVFPERKEKGPGGSDREQVVRADSDDVRATAKGDASGGEAPPGSLAALKATLRGRGQDAGGSKGYVLPGQDTRSNPTVVTDFEPDLARPLAALTVYYYTPPRITK